jgi:hypothetical protein
MPVLKNPRHERFALLLAEGLSAYAAYKQAGYQPHDGNCADRATGSGRRRHHRLLNRSPAEIFLSPDTPTSNFYKRSFSLSLFPVRSPRFLKSLRARNVLAGKSLPALGQLISLKGFEDWGRVRA